MTRKEKAKELVYKFLHEIKSADKYNYNLEDMNIFIAKQCAIIAVDEILSFYEKYEGGIDYDEYLEQVEYWNEVKTEINNP